MALKFSHLFKPKTTNMPTSPRAVELLRHAQSLREQGHLDQATAAYRSLLELHPDHWEALNTIAALTLQRGDFPAAIQSYGELIARKRDHAEAYYKRAIALGRMERWEAALADYDMAIALDPAYANAHCNRGTMLERLKRWDEALASYDRTLALNPGDFIAHYNRGSVLKDLRRFDEAISSYDQAIALKSDYVEAYVNRGNVLQELRRHEDAVASYDRAISIAPVHPEAFEGRGSSLLKLKRFDSALLDYDQAIALKPNYKFILGMRRYAKMQVCDWQDLTADSAKIIEGLKARRLVCPPFPALSLFDSPALQHLAAELFVREECPPRTALGAIPALVRRDKIRVGYFSADFRIHPVALLSAELFETHDRSRFEITAFVFGADAQDAMRTRLERAFDRFIDVRDQSDMEIAMLARNVGIDIAVDLGGFTEHSRTRIFAHRTAPIQLSYLGYLGTMGAPYMDYLIADETTVPANEQQHYSEKIIYLPSYQVNDSKRQIAEHRYTREELGLPPAGFVFCCFNSNYKIMPATFSVWMRILRRVEGSVLFLYGDNPVARRNLLRETERCGIDSHRILFGERVTVPEYLSRFRAMDLFLDTLPYNAGTTASDALWAGLPVLTCMGQTFAGRVAASVLKAIDLPELITQTSAQYEDLAVNLAEDPERLGRIKRRLTDNRLTTPLFNTRLFTKNLESAYSRIYARYQANLPPAHIYPEDAATEGSAP